MQRIRCFSDKSFPATKLVARTREALAAPFSPSSMPLYQTATFEQESTLRFSEYDYSRSGNPTRTALEDVLASLEHDTKKAYALTYTSGISGIVSILNLLKPMARILTNTDLYGGTIRLLASRPHLMVHYIDLRFDLPDSQYDLIWIETPSNPSLTCTDIARLRSKYPNSLIAVDNTVLSSILQQPLHHGADISFQSMTKFIGGHSDVTGGVISVLSDDLHRKLIYDRNINGSALSPFESWLTLRGVKTLDVRMQRQQENALEVFETIKSEIGEENVMFPINCPVNTKQARGPGSLLSLCLGSHTSALAFVEALDLFKVQVSFGSVASTVEMPKFLSHASIPLELREKIDIPDDMVRMSFGLEDSRDLVKDVRKAFSAAERCKSNHFKGRRSFSTFTRTVHGGEECSVKTDDSITTPIVLSSAFKFKSSQELLDFCEGRFDSFEYARYGNPTVSVLESKMLSLEIENEFGDLSAIASASGMTSSTTMMLALVPQNGRILTSKHCYRRTRQFMLEFMPRMGVTCDILEDDKDLAHKVEEQQYDLLFIESPTNPFLRCFDIKRLANACKQRNTVFCVDSTFATPFNQKPLDLGADLVLHSMSKYIGGHNDIVGGVIAGRSDLVSKIRSLQNILGGILDPHSAFLVLRGLKTLGVRISHQNKVALELAKYLESNDHVAQVFYPGLSSHQDHVIAKKQMNGFGGVVSFKVKGDLHRTAAFIDALKIPKIAASFGGPESLIEQPAIISYWDRSPEEREYYGISDNLVRFSCGLEEIADTIQDFENAFTITEYSNLSSDKLK